MNRLIATVFVLVTGITGCTHASMSASDTPTPAAPRQSVLPFTGLNGPFDVAVDKTGDVFVTDIAASRNETNRVLELPAGSKTQTVLPFKRPTVMADPGGLIWVIDGGQSPSHLVKLAHDDRPQTVRPVPALGRDYRGEIHAVDAEGTLYGMIGGGEVSNGACCMPVQVAKQAPASSAPQALPVQHMDAVAGMTVDTAGNLYIGDDVGKRVLKLAPGASQPSTLAFPGLRSLIDIAVDAKGSLYVVDGQQNQVLKLDPGSNTPQVLPFTGLDGPVSVAVGPMGEIYVVDDGNRRIVKLEGIR